MTSLLSSFRAFRELRRLQRRYYGAPAGENRIVAEYLAVLARSREAELASAPAGRSPVCLHAGSGGHTLRGWINIDLDVDPTVDVAADLAAAVPVRSSSVDYIHSEDFLEHLDREGGERFLREAFRILRPGGVMRLLTPDLRALIDRVYLDRQTDHLAWCENHFGSSDACAAFNMHMRMDGHHRFIYDEEHLTHLLQSIGFDVVTVRFNRSRHRHLRFLDLRDFGLNLFLECTRPEQASK